MKYLIGTDIGTSGTKTIVMDTQGRLIATDLQEYDVLTPKPLWAEQWPDVWYKAALASIKGAVEKSGVDPQDFAGMAISGLYGGSGIPLNEHMQPVRPCLIWMDRRAGAQQKWVQSTIGEERLQRITHNGADPYYGFTKILWIRDNEPENWAKTRLFLPPNAYVIYQLTGEVAMDYSSAGNLGGFFDMENRCWSRELLQDMGVPLSMMPQTLVESTQVVGGLLPKLAQELGLPAGLPVCAGGVDAGVATLGLGVFEPGIFAAAIGTSMCAALIHKEPIAGKGLIEWPYVYDAKNLSYSFGGSATAGAIVKWFRDEFAQEEKQAEAAGGPSAYYVLDGEARQIGPGSGGLLVLPYFMGERSPLWDTHAKGVIFGLSLSHSRAHVYRAFLEAVAYSLRHAMECTGQDIGGKIYLAGGVSKSPLWKQIMADVTGCDIYCPQQDVEANLGDVMLAAIGTGTLGWEDVKAWQVLNDPVRPRPQAVEIYNGYYQLYQDLYQHTKGDMQRLSQLT